MTTNKPVVVAYSWQCHGRHSTVDKKFADELVADGERVDPLIHLTDYKDLQAECAQLRAAIRRLCNIYVVDDYYEGHLRDERLEAAVNRAINAVMETTP